MITTYIDPKDLEAISESYVRTNGYISGIQNHAYTLGYNRAVSEYQERTYKPKRHYSVTYEDFGKKHGPYRFDCLKTANQFMNDLKKRKFHNVDMTIKDNEK